MPNKPTTLTKDAFQYSLPNELIAHQPAVPRDASRLLVIDRSSGALVDSTFSSLSDFLRPGDVLVRNNSKVLKARLFGFKEPTGGKVEILLNTVIKTSTNECIWECMTKPGLAVGQQIALALPLGEKADVPLVTCVGEGADHYTRLLSFPLSSEECFGLFEALGQTPLPPYIAAPESVTSDQYQTTYADQFGSVAAPTAGLHFTPEVDAALRKKGVEILEVTLHVGMGTFLPVKAEQIQDHHMHAEHFTISAEVAEKISAAKKEGRRVIAVGTTTTRVLESVARRAADGTLELTAGSGETAIFIYPPHQFAVIDAMITNFHLSESTLLMLVSAFVSAPNTQHHFTTFLESSVGKAYAHAIAEKYRFYSFGDAMLIQ